MILLDANVLIYAVNKDAPLHRKAKSCIESNVSGSETIGISWSAILAFVRLTTRPGLFRYPLPVKTAFEVIESWLSQPSVTVVHPGARHLGILRKLLLLSGNGGNLTSDANLAALALEQDAELYSADADFARFPELKWSNPLA